MTTRDYLLIDGLLRPDAIKQLYQRGDVLHIKPLYLGTRWMALKDSGPILAMPAHGSRLMQDWWMSADQHLSASGLHSSAPAQDIVDHFRRFLSPRDHIGQSCLLRFADPVILHFWLSSYTPEYLARILGPIERIRVRRPLHSWYPPTQEPFTDFDRPGATPAWDDSAAVLGEPQTAALEQAFRWLFIERLYAWLHGLQPEFFADQSAPDVETWLQRALDSGYRWGLVTEYALATWAELCQAWGLDFTDAETGPYRDWLTAHPEQARLAPELRIDALDGYRLEITGKMVQD